MTESCTICEMWDECEQVSAWENMSRDWEQRLRAVIESDNWEWDCRMIIEQTEHKDSRSSEACYQRLDHDQDSLCESVARLAT